MLTQITCSKCKESYISEEIVQTDEFNVYGSEVKNYCNSCFVEGVKVGFGNYDIGNCHVCSNPLVLQFDEEETISVAKDDQTVHYICKKIKDTLNQDNLAEVERLESEDHDSLILYTLNPDSE